MLHSLAFSFLETVLEQEPDHDRGIREIETFSPCLCRGNLRPVQEKKDMSAWIFLFFCDVLLRRFLLPLLPFAALLAPFPLALEHSALAPPLLGLQ
jgi:hypothetical protein